MILEVSGLTKRFGGFTAVDAVGFSVAEGEILGLLGPNGSGKSTTFNCIAGMLRPTAGSIRLAGQEVAGLTADQTCRRGIGRTFQLPRPFRTLSLLENAMLAAHYGAGGTTDRTEAEARARDALRLAQLPEDGPVTGLGAAGLKKLELARALATKPRLLLADESLGGLDRTEMQQAAAMLRRIRDERGIFALTPWLGLPIGVLAAALAGVALGYPCFRLRVVGHYFALVTLAAGEIVRILVTALREITGGSLGMTPVRVPPEAGLAAMQFDKAGFWWLALGAWAAGLLAWRLLDRSMSAKALAAIAEDEDAAASIGIRVTREKLLVTLLSTGLAALAGGLTAQYRMYLNPESLAGLGISLQIVFGAIAGGMYSPIGPTIGALITIGLEETLRIAFGTQFVGAAAFVYGVLLVGFMLFLPRGIAGLFDRRSSAVARRAAPAAAPVQAPSSAT